MDELPGVLQRVDVTRSRRERGAGSVFKPKFKAKRTGEVCECPHFRISYYRHGQRFVENTRSDKITVAKELLKKRFGEIASGNFNPPSAEKVLVDELMEDLFSNYCQKNGAESLRIVKYKWSKHLEQFFGKMRAADVGTSLLNRYVEKRQAQKAENGTINRELAQLRRAFNLGFHESTPRKVLQVPNFPHLKENPPRKGFVDDAQYRNLCEHATETWLRALLAVAYTFGFRKGELLALRVNQIDLLEYKITLDPGTTKNGDGRIVKMTDEVHGLLVPCVRGKNPDEFVLTWEGGKPVRDFRDRWDKLTKAAKLDGLLLHDLRRSAVRNLIRAGVPERVAMTISGHKTRAIFDRYNIVSETDLAEAAKKIERSRENSLSTAQVAATAVEHSKAEQQLIN
jgi:integrase